MSQRLAVGVDAGACNTRVALVGPRGVVLVPDAAGQPMHASVVSVQDGGQVVAGNAARALLATAPERTVAGTRRLLGRTFFSEEAKRARNSLGVIMEEGPEHSVLLRVGGQVFAPTQLHAMLLGHARMLASTHAGTDVTDAVLTVPAAFHAAQRSATVEAARQAGFNTLDVLEEPRAAVLAFDLAGQPGARACIFELGAATTTVSCVEIMPDGVRVLSAATDPHQGGEDLDARIVNWLRDEMRASPGVEIPDTPEVMHRLLAAAEEAKRTLSDADRAVVQVPGAFADASGNLVDIDRELTRADFQKFVMEMVQRIFRITDESLKTAGMTRAQVDHVLMVGGPGRLGPLKAAVARYFKRQPLNGVDSGTAVALGAARHAQMLMGGAQRPSVAVPAGLDAVDDIDVTAMVEGTLESAPATGGLPPEQATRMADATATLELRFRRLEHDVRRLEERRRELALTGDQFNELKQLRRLSQEFGREVAAGSETRAALARATQDAEASHKRLAQDLGPTRQMVDELMAQVHTLRAQVGAVDGAARSAQAQAENATTTLSHAQGAVAELSSLKDALMAQLEDLHIRHDELRDKEPVLEQALGRLNETDVISRRAEERLRLVEAGYERVAVVAEQADALHATLEASRRLQAQTEGELAGARTLLDHVKAFPLERTREDVDTLGRALGRVRQELPRVNQALASLDALDARMAALDTARGIVTRLETDLAAVAGLEQTLALARTQQAEFGATLGGLAQTLERTREQAQAAEAGVAKITQSVAQVDALQTRSEQTARRVETLEGRVEEALDHGPLAQDAQRTMDRLVMELGQLEQRAESRHGRLQELLEQLSAADTLRAELTGSVDQIRQQQADVHAAAKTVDAQLHEQADRTRQLEVAAGDLAGREGRVAALARRLEGLEARQAEAERLAEAAEARARKVADVLRALDELRSMQEQTAQATRKALESQQQVADLTSRLERVAEAERGVEERGRRVAAQQMEAERLAARVETLREVTVEVQASLELAEEQRARNEHGLERARALQQEVEQAERLLKALQRERNLGQRIDTALRKLRVPADKAESDKPDDDKAEEDKGSDG